MPVGLESAKRTKERWVCYLYCIVLYCMFGLRSAVVSNRVLVLDIWGLKVRNLGARGSDAEKGYSF